MLTAVSASLALAADDPPFTLPAQSELRKLKSAKIITNKGEIILELYPEYAPWHVANLKYLADKGFYRNLRFHKYRPKYMVQTGAPGASVASGPGYTLPPEFNELKHVPGAVSMVRPPDILDLDHRRRSHGSQFRIMMLPNRLMDGQYTVFAKVISGMEVVRRLRLNDFVKDIRVYVRQ